MSDPKQFKSVWDALEDEPLMAENMKMRSNLMMAIEDQINDKGLKQREISELLGLTQPRVSALMNGKIADFSLDTLICIAHQTGLHVILKVAA